MAAGITMSVWPGFDVGAVLGGLRADETEGALVAVEPVASTVRYLDTADVALARVGISLRHVDPGGWTIEVPVPDEGVIVREAVGPARLVPPAFAGAVAALTRGAPL